MLEVRTAPIKRPGCFAMYDNNWAAQLGTNHCDQLPAQILLGADCARIFPVNVVHPNGTPVQTKHCRLMRSVLTGHYLLFGASEPSDQILEIEFPPSLGVHLIGGDSFEDQINELSRPLWMRLLPYESQPQRLSIPWLV